MYFHVYLIYRFTRTFTDHSSVITKCWGFELQKRKIVNDPTQFEQVDEICGLSRAILYLEGLGMTVFLKTLYQSEYETLKFKHFQIEVENEKIRRFEHR